MIFRITIFLIIGAGLSACSFGLHKTITPKLVPVKIEHTRANSIDSLVLPYKTKVDAEMNVVIGKTEVDLLAARPNGNLGNVVSDAMLSLFRSAIPERSNNVFCILNHGGLRAPFSKGEITLSDLFKVLPFDNQVVLVKMPAAAMDDIKSWLKASGGHPISGFTFTQGEIRYPNGELWDGADFWLITSDYLKNGGDYAAFFSKNLKVIETGAILRESFQEYLLKTGVLKDNAEQRIQL